MITQNAIPTDAKPRFYRAANGKSGTYWIWKRELSRRGRKITIFFWYCLGNDGDAETEKEAEQEARRWIGDSQ